MTDKETRAAEIAARLRGKDDTDLWDEDDLAELCEMAGMGAEWDAASWEQGKVVAYAAADKLGIKIAGRNRQIYDKLRCMEVEWGRPCHMSDAQLWEYLDTCSSWDQIKEGAVAEFVERAGLEEEWERVQDGEIDYESVLRDACDKLGFEHLV